LVFYGAITRAVPLSAYNTKLAGETVFQVHYTPGLPIPEDVTNQLAI